MHPALQGVLTIVIGVSGCIGYFYFSNQFLDKVLFPAKGVNAGRNINRANLIRPWLFLFPALAALGLYLAYPVFETIRLSLTERLPGGGSKYVGMANYQQMLNEPKFWEAMKNNLLWLIVVPAFSTMFGLLAAQLSDRVRWGNLAKSLIFMPMAISFVGAAVIWKLVYDTRPIGQEQIGVLNAIYVYFGGDSPISWLTVPFWNNLFLMAVLVWIQTGFAMVILSAALRGIPEETVEAAIVDGANPFQVYRGCLDNHHHRRTQGFRHCLCNDQRSMGNTGIGQLHVRQIIQSQRLGRGIRQCHDHHAVGYTHSNLECL